MAAFNGKWQLTSSENMEAFMAACGVAAEVIAAVLPKINNIGGMVEEYIYDEASKTAKRNIYQNGTLTREGKTIPTGQDITDTTLDGREVTGRFDLQGPNKFVRTEKSAAGISATYEMVVSGNDLKVTMTCGSVTAVRNYTKQ